MVLEFTGKLAEGEEIEVQYELMRRRVENGVRTVVFDLRQVTDINSAGIGFLVMCLVTVEREGGQLRLAAPSERVIHALRITKLQSIFPVFDSVEAALNAPPS